MGAGPNRPRLAVSAELLAGGGGAGLVGLVSSGGEGCTWADRLDRLLAGVAGYAGKRTVIHFFTALPCCFTCFLKVPKDFKTVHRSHQMARRLCSTSAGTRGWFSWRSRRRQVRHCLCLVSTAFAAEPVPLPCVFLCLRS